MLQRTPIRVVVADDHPLIREGIIASLGRARDIRVVGEARNGEETVMLVTNLRPDVVLMDLKLTSSISTRNYRSETVPSVQSRHWRRGFFLRKKINLVTCI